MAMTQDRIDEAARKARAGIDAGESYAKRAVDRIAERATEWREEAVPAVKHAAERAEDYARQSAQWVRDRGERVRTSVVRASDNTVGYVREDPVRAVLMAAAAGALLYAVVRLLNSHRHTDHL